MNPEWLSYSSKTWQKRMIISHDHGHKVLHKDEMHENYTYLCVFHIKKKKNFELSQQWKEFDLKIHDFKEFQ